MEGATTHATGKTSMELSGDVKLFINRFGSGGDLPELVIPLELKILGALVMLFLFLLFLIAVLWDRYGKEIGELYTPGAASRGDVNGASHCVYKFVHDVLVGVSVV